MNERMYTFIWGKANIHGWKPCLAGDFSVKSFFMELNSCAVAYATCSFVWLGLAPPKVHALFWLPVARKVAATENVGRRGFDLNISGICPLRGKDSANTII